MRCFFHKIYVGNINFILITMILAVLAWSLVLILFSKKPKIGKVVCTVGIVFFLTTVMYMTLFARPVLERVVVLIPFHSFLESRTNPEILRQMIMNVFLFEPFGMLLPFILQERVKKPVLITVISAAVFSALIETVQGVFKLGRCEVDDIIMNTLGALLGTVSYIIFTCLKAKEKT